MASSRQTRGRARPRIRAQARPCQAPLPDEKTCCPSRANGRGRFCAAHGREYGQLTKTYKDASDRVDTLEEEIQQAMERIDALDGIAALDAAAALASRFLDALGDEIDGRETHHRRFFQTSVCPFIMGAELCDGGTRGWLITSPGVLSPPADESHGKWLKRRRGQEAAAVRLLERLRKRREEVVATEAAAKEEARRREFESLAQLKATEKARLRAIELLQLQAIEQAHLRASEVAQRRATGESARQQAMENARIWNIAEAQRTATQARGVLGERTNITPTSSNQTLKDAGPKSEWVPPGTWTSDAIDPPPRLPPRPTSYQLPHHPPPARGTYYDPQHHDVQSAGESRPSMRSASTTGTPVSMGPISPRPVDIERQVAPAAPASWQAYPERTTPRHEDSLDCGCVRTALFWIVTFFVFCYLVVVDGLQ